MQARFMTATSLPHAPLCAQRQGGEQRDDDEARKKNDPF